LRYAQPEEKNRDQKREELRGVQLLARRLAGRKCFVEDLLGAVRTPAAATRHTQTQMEFAQRTGTAAHRVADLAFGNTIAEANVHGWTMNDERT
jgi:hypothetical protein